MYINPSAKMLLKSVTLRAKQTSSHKVRISLTTVSSKHSQKRDDADLAIEYARGMPIFVGTSIERSETAPFNPMIQSFRSSESRADIA